MVKSVRVLLKPATERQPEQVLTMRISLPKFRYQDDRQVAALLTSLIDRLQKLPGIESVGTVTEFSLFGRRKEGKKTTRSKAIRNANQAKAP